MSSAQKSGSKCERKFATKFALEGIYSMLSPKTTAKDVSQVVTASQPRVMATRAKFVATKRKRSVEPEMDPFDVEKHLHDALTGVTNYARSYHDKVVKELEQNLAELRTLTATKDKTISKMLKEKRIVDDQLLDVEERIREEVRQATQDAKVWAAKSVLEARIKMAMESSDLAFDRSAWEVANWQQGLDDFGKRRKSLLRIRLRRLGLARPKRSRKV